VAVISIHALEHPVPTPKARLKLLLTNQLSTCWHANCWYSGKDWSKGGFTIMDSFGPFPLFMTTIKVDHY
jgi:hypothetical protein